MNIAILTQPLGANYGGILQNYALQQVMKTIGHDVITIDRHIYRSNSFIKDIAKLFFQKILPSFDVGLLTDRQKQDISQLQQSFVNKYIKRSKRICTQQAFDKFVRENSFDAYIVGSDQCWRPCYSPNILNYFLDFVDEKVKKIAYAASFGVDNWEFPNDLTLTIRELAKKIDYISVREKSGIRLCKQYLEIEASWVLDPTLLLGREGFLKFICPNRHKYVLNYLLEESNDARNLVNTISRTIGISTIRSNISSPIFRRREPISNHKNISVEQWLDNIYNAAFVVTDSFHGAAFSILFNKPFVVRLNSVRGNTRLESLLTDFNLSDCIYRQNETIRIPKFNWNEVNARLLERRQYSYKFLKKALR